MSCHSSITGDGDGIRRYDSAAAASTIDYDFIG